ncbi:HNH endonuclease signature motif containing protein, partial [Mycobacterium asiaticum]|uniref:HNH endonuclease signature motif containing protein n=1 Tax=Mycobacterium asiaticum TaxID=1790 RepID=UPI001FD0376B
MDEVIDHREGLTAKTAESAGWIARIQAAARVQNQAAALEFVAVGQLFGYRLSRSAETEDWAMDTMEAVAAEVAAGLKISHGLGLAKVRYARAMRERLPQVAEVFIAGDIDFSAFATIVSRTDLITDPQALAYVDTRIAASVTRWPSLTAARLAKKVDTIVAQADLDAVRRRKKNHKDREVYIGEDCEGTSEIHGSLASPDARALDAKLSALAATVCPHDPRTRDQRRADALGAMAADATRLGCRCGRPDCTAAQRKPASPVTIHVIAEQATLTGNTTTPASQISAEGLITAELLAELALTATLVPLIHPGDAPPEPHYRPSQALADFVRARDMTCRWPGCDVAATHCDLDHTIPYNQGGPTHAGNLNCFCRRHHLIKTFWGWSTRLLPNGNLILTSPTGDTHATVPGSALHFPSLCRPVGGMPTHQPQLPQHYCAERTAMMPRRHRTRAQHRAHRIATERRHNRNARLNPANCSSADTSDFDSNIRSILPP